MNFNFQAEHGKYELDITLIGCHIPTEDDALQFRSAEVHLYEEGDWIWSGDSGDLYSQFKIDLCSKELELERDAAGFWPKYDKYVKDERDEAMIP